MVRLTRQACAQIGRLATPTPDKLGVTVEDKAKDFFREVNAVLCLSVLVFTGPPGRPERRNTLQQMQYVPLFLMFNV